MCGFYQFTESTDILCEGAEIILTIDGKLILCDNHHHAPEANVTIVKLCFVCCVDFRNSRFSIIVLLEIIDLKDKPFKRQKRFSLIDMRGLLEVKRAVFQ